MFKMMQNPKMMDNNEQPKLSAVQGVNLKIQKLQLYTFLHLFEELKCIFKIINLWL